MLVWSFCYTRTVFLADLHTFFPCLCEEFGVTVISGRLPAGYVLISPQTAVAAGFAIIFKATSIVLKL